MAPWSLVLVRCLDCSAISVRQCNFQNLVLVRPNRPLEHRNTLDSRRPVLLTKPSHWKQRQCEQMGLFITQYLTPWSEKFLPFQRSRGSKKSTFWKRHWRAKIALGSRHLTQNEWSWCHFVGKWMFYQMKYKTILFHRRCLWN